jgi:hypothetical protein
MYLHYTDKQSKHLARERERERKNGKSIVEKQVKMKTMGGVRDTLFWRRGEA